MPISPLGGQDRLRAAAAAAALRANSANGATRSAPARQPDILNISDTGRSMVAAHKAVAGAPDVREDRVSALKASIADGSYTVDSRALAAKLLSNS